MAEVKVLIEGYAIEKKDGWRASSTVTLIKSAGKIIIADPGCNREKLLAALRRENIRTADVDFVFLTHGHIDHALLAGIFDRARFVTFEGQMYDKDLQLEFDENVMGADTRAIKTPGHAPEHISLIVDTAEGKYAVAGDVFWWAAGEEQEIDINKKDESHPAELNMKDLAASRKKLLEMADFVIPGHGKVFKV